MNTKSKTVKRVSYGEQKRRNDWERRMTERLFKVLLVVSIVAMVVLAIIQLIGGG